MFKDISNENDMFYGTMEYNFDGKDILAPMEYVCPHALYLQWKWNGFMKNCFSNW